MDAKGKHGRIYPVHDEKRFVVQGVTAKLQFLVPQAQLGTRASGTEGGI
jgi:hypothetical protein